MESIAGLPIVDILRVGLSGLCFLLAFLAYQLIGKEQERGGSPRRGILRIIQVFIASNLLAGILCAISGYIVRSPVPTCTPELVGSYVPDSVFFIVDLEGWQPEGKGPVVVTRADHVRKITPKNEDYVIPYFTTGDSIRCDPMPGPTRPTFVRNNSPELKGRVQYDYRLPIGHQPAGYSEMVTSKFTFPTGFKNPQKEWWQARIAYPTKNRCSDDPLCGP